MKIMKSGSVEVVVCLLFGALLLGVLCIIEALRKD